MTAILHTWGSNLFYHPHIHCIVPGGGVDKQGVWHHLKGCKHRDFLFPVAAMSTKFRGKFMSLLTRRLKEKDIVIEQSVRKHCFAMNTSDAMPIVWPLQIPGYRMSLTRIFPSITKITEVVGSTKSPTLELTIS